MTPSYRHWSVCCQFYKLQIPLLQSIHQLISTVLHCYITHEIHQRLLSVCKSFIVFLEIADLCFKCFNSVCNLTDNIGILTSSVNDISEVMSRDVGICFLLGIDVFYFFIKFGGHSEEILLGRQYVLHTHEVLLWQLLLLQRSLWVLQC